METVKVIECPRDAWQGLQEFIPTEYKAEYLKQLALAGFRHIDAVSFVSPKHVKQMADSEEVMAKLNAALPSLSPEHRNRGQDTGATIEPLEIIGIVVNEKGLERALATPGVTTIGYPYSISAYFRRANANMTREETRQLVEKLKKQTAAANRGLVVYISMAFGNPYDEPWGPEIVTDALEWLKDIRVRTVSLADTVGTATPELVGNLYREVKTTSPGLRWAFICTAARRMRKRKFLPLMKPDAADLTAHSPALAVVLLLETIWLAISQPKTCWRRWKKPGATRGSTPHG